jgi:hypothetical protein
LFTVTGAAKKARVTLGGRLAMTDNIPLGQFEPVCPHCGAKIGPKSGAVELKDETRIFCPVHGDVGNLQEVRAAIVEQHRNEIVDKAKEAVRALGI